MFDDDIHRFIEEYRRHYGDAATTPRTETTMTATDAPAVEMLSGHDINAMGLYQAASLYALFGVAVFPLRAGDKKPATGNGFKDATTDLLQIDQWWAANENYNIGAPAGFGFDVVDLDGVEASELIFADEDWETDLLGHVATPRDGGHHLYYPPNPTARNGVSLRTGIDVRAAGGYVVLPPSRLNPALAPKGKTWNPRPYRWVRPLQIGITP